MKNKNHKESSLAFGVLLGTLFGILIDNIGLGVSLGVALGAAAMYSREEEDIDEVG